MKNRKEENRFFARNKKEKNRFLLRGKKGLTMKYLITIIILIVSFGIIALFFAMYGFEIEVDKEACHQSVIYKASIPEWKEKRDIVDLPLNCETEKICISMDKKGNCDEDFKGEKYVTRRVSSDATQRENDMRKVFADAFYDCWWMMGQGKVQVFTRKDDVQNNCVMCSRIAFDKELKLVLEKDQRGVVRGITKYMINNTVPNSKKTYWQYITNSESSFRYGYEESKDIINLNQHVILFSEVDSGDSLKWLITGGVSGAVGGGVLAGATIGSVVPVAGTVIGAGIGALAGYFGTDKIVGLFKYLDAKAAASVSLNEYNYDTLKKLKCTSFEG